MLGWLALALVGCGGTSDYGLSPVAPAVSGPSAPSADVSADVRPTSSSSTSPSTSGPTRTTSFDVGGDAKAPVADFLFVVDGSKSMRKVLEQVRKGFLGLAGSDAWPADARIAVMSTTPADFADLSKPYPAVHQLPGLEHAPGFLRLVSRDTIAEYRAAAPKEIAARFPADGCGAWFTPGEVDDHGVPCLVAATQIDERGVRVEAGLTAFSQLLEKNAGHATFRDGAAVNVIFVSDTHDPGIDPFTSAGGESANHDAAVDLAKHRPTYDTLLAQVDRDNVVASFRVSAIAPVKECSERWYEIGPVYFDAADASGGLKADVCTTTDYTGFVRDLARTGGTMTRPVVAVGGDVAGGDVLADVDGVTVDGKDVGYTVRGGAVVLKGPMPSARSHVTVTWRPSASSGATSSGATSSGTTSAGTSVASVDEIAVWKAVLDDIDPDRGMAVVPRTSTHPKVPKGLDDVATRRLVALADDEVSIGDLGRPTPSADVPAVRLSRVGFAEDGAKAVVVREIDDVDGSVDRAVVQLVRDGDGWKPADEVGE